MESLKAAVAEALSEAKVKLAAAKADLAVAKEAKESAEKALVESKSAYARNADNALKTEKARNKAQVRTHIPLNTRVFPFRVLLLRHQHVPRTLSSRKWNALRPMPCVCTFRTCRAPQANLKT